MKKEVLDMRQIPGTDLTVSALCFGTGSVSLTLPDKELFYLLDAFVDAGGNFFDTANVYGKWAPWFDNRSEQRLGQWLATHPGLEVVMATKGAHYDLADPARPPRVDAASITADVEESLASLGLETIPFYWLHRDDPTRPIGEILEVCEGLRRAGKIRWYGASNYSAARLFEADAYAKAHGLTGFRAVSNQWSLAKPTPGHNNNPDPTLVLMDAPELAFHTVTGTACIPYQATARGWFAKAAAGAPVDPGVAAAFDSPENRATLAALMDEAAATGHSVQALAVANLAKGQAFPVIPITAASNEAQMQSLLEAMALLQDDKA